MAYPAGIESTLYHERVTSPELAYLLGLIWADGHVSNPSDTRRSVVVVKMVAEDLLPLKPIFDKVGRWATCLSDE